MITPACPYPPVVLPVVERGQIGGVEESLPWTLSRLAYYRLKLSVGSHIQLLSWALEPAELSVCVCGHAGMCVMLGFYEVYLEYSEPET